jgi:hypothetical protein
MKKLGVIVLLIGMLYSCQRQKAEMSKLQAQNDSLQIVASQSDRNLIEYVEAYNEIQDNLTKIKEAENIIDVNTNGTELQDTGKEQIISDINMIYHFFTMDIYVLYDLFQQ